MKIKEFIYAFITRAVHLLSRVFLFCNVFIERGGLHGQLGAGTEVE